MTEILIRILNIVERFRNMRELNSLTMAIFAAMLLFGVMNCILGYRLMRFWMMLGGFAAGCGAAFLLAGSMGIQEREVLLAVMLLAGIVLAVVAFLIYRLGVFLIGAGIGLSISVYVLHPTTSFVFFLCMLCGGALGALAVRFSKEIIITGTSLVGGIFAGFGLCRLGEMPEKPYGLAMSAGFALLGLLIQFASNRVRPEEIPEDEEEPEGREEAYDDYDECDEEAYEEAYREMYGDQPVSHIIRRRQKDAAEDAEPQENRGKRPGENKASRTGRRHASPYSSGGSVSVQLKKPAGKKQEGSLKVPLQEWQEEPPEPTIVVRDRPEKKKTNTRK